MNDQTIQIDGRLGVRSVEKTYSGLKGKPYDTVKVSILRKPQLCGGKLIYQMLVSWGRRSAHANFKKGKQSGVYVWGNIANWALLQMPGFGKVFAGDLLDRKRVRRKLQLNGGYVGGVDYSKERGKWEVVEFPEVADAFKNTEFAMRAISFWNEQEKARLLAERLLLDASLENRKIRDENDRQQYYYLGRIGKLDERTN